MKMEDKKPMKEKVVVAAVQMDITLFDMAANWSIFCLTNIVYHLKFTFCR